MRRRAMGFALVVSVVSVVVGGVAWGDGSGAAAPDTPVAQASASAVSLTVAGQHPDTGRFQAVNDGTSQTTSGSRTPAVTVLAGQSLLTAGTLAQDATTGVTDGAGHSAACAGLAGSGATLAAVGDDGSCLAPGGTVRLDAGHLDLGHLQIAQSALLQGQDAQLSAALQPVLGPLTAALQTGLDQAVTRLGLGVGVDLGAVQSSCTAGPGTATGDARLAGGTAYVEVGGQRVDLLDLPADPPPDTHLVTGLGDVATTVETALRSQLAVTLADLPSGATLPPGVDRTAMLDDALASVGLQLAPLQDNVLDITLNRQTRATPDDITVQALDLSVVPAAQQFGVTPFELAVGTTSCGPGGRVAAVAAPSPTPAASPLARRPKATPTVVPTSVPAGLASAPAGSDPLGPGWSGLLVAGGLVATAVGAVGAGWCRVRRPGGRRGEPEPERP